MTKITNRDGQRRTYKKPTVEDRGGLEAITKSVTDGGAPESDIAILVWGSRFESEDEEE